MIIYKSKKNSMVSSPNLERLKKLVADFSAVNLDFSDADSSELSDVKFEVFTAEAFIMGIADSILTGENRTTKQHIEILEKPLLDESRWITPINTKMDLSDHIEVLNYIEGFEKIRTCCLRILK